MHFRIPQSKQRATRLLLDHGADETTCQQLRLGERGATFESPWRFTPMAEMIICLAWEHPRLGPQRTPVNGIVLSSRRLGRAKYETTVLFLDLPEAERSSLREFAEMVV